MTRDQIILYDNKTLKTLEISRMNVYMRSKIIEAWDDEGQVYYLFFYRNRFLTACKARRLKLRSFIADSFKKGISVDSPHPFIRKVIRNNETYKILDFQQLLTKLQTQFSSYEQAFILTFFESFIRKKELFTQIQDIYYRFRRNGQMLASYQTIRILHDFAPKNRWARETANLIEYAKYFSLYREFSNQLLASDVIYGEKLLYDERENKACLERLEASLLHHGLIVDAAVLAVEDFLITPEEERYNTLMERLPMVFSEEEICEILEDLITKKPDFPPLQMDLVERLIKLERYEEGVQRMIELEISPSTLSAKAQDAVLELILSDAHALPYEKLNTFLIPLLYMKPEKTEKAIERCVSFLLKEYDVDYVGYWLTPLKNVHKELPIFGKIARIMELKDDPDKQMELGKIYYELNLLDHAIDCFSWEMELDATNRKPVEWLAKVYKKMGRDSEAEAYLHLLENEAYYTEPVH